jgi:hypothetical protein
VRHELHENAKSLEMKWHVTLDNDEQRDVAGYAKGSDGKWHTIALATALRRGTKTALTLWVVRVVVNSKRDIKDWHGLTFTDAKLIAARFGYVA